MRPQGEALQHEIGQLHTLESELECFQFGEQAFRARCVFAQVALQAGENIRWQNVSLVQLTQPIVEIQRQAAGIQPWRSAVAIPSLRVALIGGKLLASDRRR